MATHSILSLCHLASALTAEGIEVDTVLNRHGLALDKLVPDSRINFSKDLQIFCELCEKVQDPYLMFQVGGNLGITDYGPFGMLLLTSATPYEAFRYGIRFHALTYLFGRLGFTPHAEYSEVTIDPIDLPAWAYRLRVDLEVAGTINLMLEVTRAQGREMRPLAIHLPYAKPKDSHRYADFFGCPVVFGDSQVRIRIPNFTSGAKQTDGKRIAHAMYLQQCEQLHTLAMREDLSDIATQVRTHLQLFQDKLPTAAAVAHTFGMSERSLFDQLRKQNASYRILVDEVRLTKARQLLEHSNASMEKIALQLGYAETASFIRAFQRWTGHTPARFRKLQRDADA